jgi:hypothetical protein
MPSISKCIGYICTLCSVFILRNKEESIKPGFHMVVTVGKIVSRSFSHQPKYNILELKIRGVTSL